MCKLRAQGALSYASGVIHHAKLKHLKPGHTYFYRCGDPEFPGQWSDVLNFTMPRATGRHEFPFRLGVIADIGQTYNSTGAQPLADLTPPAHPGPLHIDVEPREVEHSMHHIDATWSDKRCWVAPSFRQDGSVVMFLLAALGSDAGPPHHQRA